MFNYFVGPDTEAATGTQRAGKGANDHVDFGGVDVLMLGDAAACAAEYAEGPGFVKDEAEFVAEFEHDLARSQSSLYLICTCAW